MTGYSSVGSRHLKILFFSGVATLLAALFVLIAAPEARSQTSDCPPYSTLSCDQVGVDRPYNLDFSGDEGGLDDAGGAGTGFTMVQPTSNGDGYLPGNLDVAGGDLTINTTPGIQYKAFNTLDNALGAGFDASTPARIETNLAKPDFPNANGAEQGGLWFGPDEDNYVKLVLFNNGSGNSKIQMVRETNAQSNGSTSDDERNTADNAVTGQRTQVRLAMELDPASGTVTGKYRIGDGAEISFSPMEVPDSFFDGSTFDTPVSGASGFAGLFATNRNGPDPIDVSFQNFSIGAAPETAPESDGVIETENLDGVPYNDRLAFSRIGSLANPPGNGVHDRATVRLNNTGPESIEISGFSFGGPDASDWTVEDAPSLPADIAPGGSLDVKVRFVAESGKRVHNGTLTIASNASNEKSTVIELGGWWQSVSEDGQEPSLQQIVDTFGWTTDIVGSGEQLNQNGLVNAVGDEVLSPYWKRADTSKAVNVRQIDAFHSYPAPATVKWFPKSNAGANNNIFTQEPQDGQSFLPRKNGDLSQPASGSFTPNSQVFGFKVDGESSDPTKNNQTTDQNNGCQGPCGHHVRFWPVTDRDGSVVPNTYFMWMDYSGINYDYNDNGYIISNISPEKPAAPTNLAASAGDGEVSISWDESSTGAAGYNVYRGTSENVSTGGTPLNGGSPVSGTSYTDDTAQNGTTYYYVVQAVDGSGTKSNASTAARATPAAASEVTDFKVNFQSEDAPVPDGYLRDFGQEYGQRSGADQGNGLSYGWVEPGTQTPLSLVTNGRDRDLNNDQRLDTLIHMQGNDVTNFNGVAKEGAWEISVPDGAYEVTVAAGDPSANDLSRDPELHTLNVEGQNAVFQFVPTGAEGSATHHATATVTAYVTDGRLTIDPEAGTNTKINYVEAVKVDGGSARPRVIATTPENLATGASLTAGITSDLSLPGSGVDDTTLQGNATLERVSDGQNVPGQATTSGGADTVSFAPSDALDPGTAYRFRVGDGVTDDGGNKFLPYTSVFTTGRDTGGGNPDDIAFEKLDSGSGTAMGYSSVTKGPDGKLYAATLDGYIFRWNIDADGTLSGKQTITTVRDNAVAAGLPGAPDRTVIGLAFDPASTANNPVLWVTDNVFQRENAPEWTSKIARLSGPNLGSYQEILTGLPRSARDHETNSIAFGPDGNLYFAQGAMNAMGAADGAWSNRPERLLSAAVLKLDPEKLPASLPLDVKTPDGGGSYDPYAQNAPLTLYATGVRNAYDLVWHSNGRLYAPTNGSAAGGNTPATPSTLPASCQNRIDKAQNGDYTGPQVPAINNNPQAETDFVFDVKQGKYYGHPNPARCEWVLNNGNPIGGSDPYQTDAYPVGTQPDRNYDLGNVYNAGLHASANGVIEYKGNAFGGALDGKLLNVRFSQGKDIQTFDVASDGSLSNRTPGSEIPGFGGFGGPLDLTEDTATGNIYVADFGAQNNPGGRISLLRPLDDSAGNPNIAVDTGRLIFNDVSGGAASASKTVEISNNGNAPLEVSGLSISGADSGQFEISNQPNLPATISKGESASVDVAFDPNSVGVKDASLDIESDDPSNGTESVSLRGLGTKGNGGANEPSLQQILDTYEIAVDAGDDDSSTNPINSDNSKLDGKLGDEIDAQSFTRVTDGPVTVEPIAVFGPQDDSGTVSTVGYYDQGDAASKQQLFTAPNASYQSLDPKTSGQTTFDPGAGEFGFYSNWPFFSDRPGDGDVYQEDSLNDFDNNVKRHVRAYPLPGEKDAYVIATEETTSGYDYQDVVFIARNVQPADASAETGCSPYSTLDCSKIKVGLPYSLDWSGDEGKLADGSGTGTGFTMADPPSAPLATPTNSDAPGYEPGNLAVASGALNITSTPGIMYKQPSTSPRTNSQVNALGVGVDATKAQRIETTISNPTFPSASNPEQGGLWFGLDEDNYVKLVVSNTGNGNGKIQLLREVGAQSSAAADEVNSDNFSGVSSQDVTLALVPDATANSVTAYYQLGSGQEQELGSLDVPAGFFSGKQLPGDAGSLSFAGIFDTNRTGPSPIDLNFTDFSIEGQDAINQAPEVTNPGDQTNAEGDGVSLQIEATDPDQGNTLAYSAQGLPPGLSIDGSTGEVSGTIESGAADDSPYDVTVTATDDGSPAAEDSASFAWDITASGCPPYSTLECGEVPVAKPYNLDFSGDEGGLGDANDAGTGFTMVQPSSNGGEYLPERLDLSGGALTITTTNGIQYKTADTTTNGNSLDNGLGVGVDAASGITQVQTTLINPPGGTGKAEQGGLWFGPDEDNYVKLVVVSTGTNQQRVQLLREVGGASAAADEINIGGLDLTASNVHLRLVADADAKTVTAYYQDGDGAEQEVGSFDVPAGFFSDSTVSDKFPDSSTFAGIFATHRSNTTTSGLDFAFDDFSVAGEQAAPGELAVDPASLGFGDVTVGESATEQLTLTNEGESDLTVSSADLSGADAEQFSADLAVPLTIAPGGSGSLEVGFAPTSAGAKSATLALTNDGADSPVSIDLSGTGVAANQAPQAADDAYATDEGKTLDVGAADGVLANDTDADDDALTATLADDVQNGTLNLDSNGSFTYEPDAGFAGEDSFTYRASDGADQSGLATATITVNAVNEPPALDEIPDANVEEGQSKTIDLSATDPDNDSIELASADLPNFATLTDNGDGTGSIELSPAAGDAGTYNATVTATDTNGGTDSRSFTITVSEQQLGALAANPESLEFDDTTLGQQSAEQLTLSNNGDGALTVSDLSFSGKNPTAFSADLQTPVTLQPDEDKTVTVTFKPGGTVTAVRTATMTLANDGSGGTVEVSLSGNGVAPNQAPTVQQIEDQSALEGEAVSLQIEATDPDQGDTLAYSAEGLPPGLSIDGSTGEVSGTIESGAADDSPYDVTVTASDDNGGSDSASFEFEVGERVAGLEAQPRSLDFGGIQNGSESEELLTLRNTGNTELTIRPQDVSLTGTDAGQFTANLDGAATLAPDKTVEIPVKFTPTGAGDRSAALEVAYGESGKLTVDLSGQSVPEPVGNLEANVNDLDFGKVKVGGRAAKVVRLTNGGDAALDLRSASISGRDAGSFETSLPNKRTLEPGQSVNLRVFLDPDRVGVKRATLSIESSAGEPTQVKLKGKAVPGARGCTIMGTPKNDVLRGTPGRDVICGLGGNDKIYGLGGNDVLYGDAGNDILYGGGGNDRLTAGPGNDRLFGQAGIDTLNVRDGRGGDFANGGPGKDRCLADPADRKVSCP